MTDRGFGGAKWSFFEDRSVERSPSGILAICDQPVAWTHGPAMSLIDSENRCRPGFGEHWEPFYHIQFLFSKVNILLAIDPASLYCTVFQFFSVGPTPTPLGKDDDD